MVFEETLLVGAYIINLQKIEDERGFFARSWCQREFGEHSLSSHLVQCNISFNRQKGTLRGMHFQFPPAAESKLVRCTRGGIYDVIIDLRPDSPTFLQWVGVELTAENRTALYMPKGFAHGFQSLENDTEVFYQMSEFYAPQLAGGVRWNDPQLGIIWPLPVSVISKRDQEYGDLDPAAFAPFAVNGRLK
jgi:dTDP-4-dehydrorhamnose 3,5-epimerase